jgi:WD40 repeat protein
MSVAFSPDGGRIASASLDGTVKVWDALGRSEVLICQQSDDLDVSSIAFSPDGKRIAGAAQDAVWVWDAATGRKAVAFSDYHVDIRSVAFSPDGKHVASAGWDGTVKIWAAVTGKRIQTLEHDDALEDATYGSRGELILGTTGNGVPVVWDVATGNRTDAVFRTEASITHVALSADGRHFAGVGDVGKVWRERPLRIFDAKTCEEIATIDAHDWRRMVFSPDGQQLVTYGEAEFGFAADVDVWDARTGRRIMSLPCESGASSVAFSPDGQRIATSSFEGVKLWDPRTGQEILAFGVSANDQSGEEIDIAFSPDGQRIAAACDEGVRIWYAPWNSEGESRAP